MHVTFDQVRDIATEPLSYYEYNPWSLDFLTSEYVATLLWSSINSDSYDDDSVPETLDGAPPSNRFAADCLADVRDFLRANAAALAGYCNLQGYGLLDGLTHAMHDFALTRNHHGAGFWDRGVGKVGDVLTEAAHTYGGFDPYLGDDGLVYA